MEQIDNGENGWGGSREGEEASGLVCYLSLKQQVMSKLLSIASLASVLPRKMCFSVLR